LIVTSTQKRSAQQDGKQRGPAKLLPSAAEHHRPRLQTPSKNWSEWPTKAVRVFRCEPQPGEVAYATPEEQKVLERQQARAPEVGLPFIAVEPEGDYARFVPEHSDALIGWQLVMDVFASANRTFVEGLMRQLYFATDARFPDAELDFNFLVSVVQSLKPRDETEAMLATQIAVAQSTSLRFAGRLARATTPEMLEMYERIYSKIARVLAAQFEALKRYRTGGEQKIIVQHTQNVSVEGQAIVGNVTQMKGKVEDAPTASAAAPLALPNAAQEAMPIIDVPAHEAVPVRARGRRKASK
jgi:hypothetical protein